MSASLLQSMTWLHRWSGLVFGWAIYVIALTGAIVVFSDEIDGWMRPELPAAKIASIEAVSTAETWLSANAPAADHWSITLSALHGGVAATWSGERGQGSQMLDARSGQPLSPRETHGAEPLVDLHFRLHSGPVGMWVVAACGMVMLVGLATGLVVHRRIFRDFFTFRPNKGQRSWLDGHNVVGVATLPFQIFIAFTGLMIFPVLLMPGALAIGFGGDRAAYVETWYAPTSREEARKAAPLAPLAPIASRAEAILGGRASLVAVSHPGDAAAIVTVWRATDDRLSMMADWAAFDGASGRLLDSQTRYPSGVAASGVMVGLHFAKFGGMWTRWLYFVSGLASAALAATGLILWVVKRRTRSAAHDPGLRVADTLNLATIAGLAVALAAYFAANRLLPASLPERDVWEVWTMFGAWALCLGWAMVRRDRIAWAAMTALAGLGMAVAAISDVVMGYVSEITLVFVITAAASALAAWTLRKAGGA